MSNTSFYVALAALSRNADRKNEAARILSFFERRPVTQSDILREEGGRPYFRQRASCIEADFNISHSGGLIAVSYVKSKAPNCKRILTGCDIQQILPRKNPAEIAKQFFSPNEAEYISGEEKRFFEIWTLKECFLKLRGLSVFDMAKAPCFIDKNFCLKKKAAGAHFFSYMIKDIKGARYMLAAAIKGSAAAPQLLWL